MAVTYSGDGAVGTITLDKPPANSYDLDYMRELDAAVDEGSADGDARVVVVRSSSEKFFCAGADIKAFQANDVDANVEMIRFAHGALAKMAASDKLFVAWVAGHALGGGLEIALACDLRYALNGDFGMGTPEVTLGILPGNGGTQRLPRLIGTGPALDLLLTGRQVKPEEALRLGVVTALFDDAEAFDKHVGKLAAGAPLAYAGIKRSVHQGTQKTLDEGMEQEIEEIARLFATADAHEGIGAFTEKRKAEFKGA